MTPETNTVTISLDKYEEMKSELERLRKENQEKTIYKYAMHPIYGIVLIVFMFTLAIVFNRITN